MKSNKILVITDQMLLDIGLLTPCMTLIQSKYRVEIYTDVEPEPSLACAQWTAVYVNFNLETQKTEPIPQSLKHELSQHVYIES